MSDLFKTEGHTWWDTQGPFGTLHAINGARLSFMRRYVPHQPGYTVLDLGCGGGLVCEPFARLGARVTGVDSSKSAIDGARHHAQRMGLNIHYAVGERPPADATYDVICVLDVLEHVLDPEKFIRHALSVLRPGGVLFISTINRTLQSWVEAIVCAEYILGWLPKGTHQWKQFLTPGEVAHMVRPCRWRALQGIRRRCHGLWKLCDNPSTNYIGCIHRA